MVQRMSNKNGAFFEKHPLALHLLIMLGVSIVVLIIILMSLKLFTRHGREYEMPDLVGMTLEQAEEQDNINLEFVVTDSTYQDGVAPGQILMQEPRAGQMVKKGRKVYVTITANKEGDAEMPSIISQPLRVALSRLVNAGLQGGKLSFVVNPQSTKGLESEVLSISYLGRSIQAGDKVPKGSYIDIQVGLNDQELGKQAAVPMLLGKNPREARQQLLSKSLNVGVEHYDADVRDRSRARVYQQSPEYVGIANQRLGTYVELWYKNMDDEEAGELVRNYTIDSSQLGSPDDLQDSIMNAMQDEF